MKLRATRLGYTIEPKSFSIAIVDQSDPQRSFNIVMDTNNITLSKQSVIVINEPHSITAPSWNKDNVLDEAAERLEAVLGKLEEAPEQIESLIETVKTIVGQLETSQQHWNSYKEKGLLKDYYSACAHLRNVLLYAKNAGVHLEGVTGGTSYPPLEEEEGALKVELSASAQLLRQEIQTTFTDVRATLARETQRYSQDLITRSKQANQVAEGAQTKANEAFKIAENIEFKVTNDLLSEEGALRRRVTMMEKEIEATLAEVKSYQEEKLAEIEALLEKSGKTERQLARLTQKEAADAMTNQFKHAAVEAGESAINWTGAFFIVGGIAMGCIIWLINNPPAAALTGEMGWLAIFGRLSLTAAMAYMLGYSGLQATRQRNAKLYFRRMGIEMIALDAYLSPYDDETALGIKSELMKAYFGKVDAPGYQKEGDLPSIDILGRVTEVIARRKAKEDPKDEADKTGVEALAKKLLEKGGVNAVDLALKLLTLEDKKDTPTKDDKPS